MMPIDRSTLLTGMAGAGLAGGCATTGTGTRPDPRGRPNIPWLVSEDNNPFIGAYGDALAHTPHIDAMARSGLLYRKVYANAPVCAPSRFCLLPGNPFLGRTIAAPKRLAFGMRNRMDERYDFVRTVSDGSYRYIRPGPGWPCAARAD